MRVLLITLFAAMVTQTFGQQKVTFESQDDIIITADLYEADPGASVILLCHQANSSRGEYKEIAPKLVALGYTCLAIDQRSGKEMNGVRNETHVLAVQNKYPTEYLYAEQDILASVDYLSGKYEKPITVVGSSYSASEALMIAAKNKKIQRIAVFSPGEYFDGLSVSTYVQYIQKPVFATASKSEMADVRNMMGGMDQNWLTVFEPAAAGIHGARALQRSTPNHEEYWEALKRWLEASK